MLDERHLVDKTAKFSLALFQKAELALFEEACIPTGCRKVFTDRRVFVFSNTLMEVSGFRADIFLTAASIDDSSKFLRVDDKRPKSRGRLAKYFHPLLKKGKYVSMNPRKILPQNITDSLSPKGSRLAHLLLQYLNICYLSLFDLIMTLAKRPNVVNEFLICFYEMFYRNFLSSNEKKGCRTNCT